MAVVVGASFASPGWHPFVPARPLDLLAGGERGIIRAGGFIWHWSLPISPNHVATFLPASSPPLAFVPWCKACPLGLVLGMVLT